MTLGERMQEQHDATVAYVRDRAEQYSNDSCCRVALENVAVLLQAGEHMSSYAAGELDDLIGRPMRTPRWDPTECDRLRQERDQARARVAELEVEGAEAQLRELRKERDEARRERGELRATVERLRRILHAKNAGPAT